MRLLILLSFCIINLRRELMSSAVRKLCQCTVSCQKETVKAVSGCLRQRGQTRFGLVIWTDLFPGSIHESYRMKKCFR